MLNRLRYAAAGKSEIGKVRKKNQDAFFVDHDLGLFAVSDGIGGNKAGEVASEIAVRIFREAFRQYSRGVHDQDLGRQGQKLTKRCRHLLHAALSAHRAVREAGEADESKKGMGATLAAVWLDGHTAAVLNIGDSPIFLIREGEIQALSTTHTLEAELKAGTRQHSPELDRITKKALTRAVGIRKHVVPSLKEIRLLPNDLIVLCSDGVSNKLGDEEIAFVSSEHDPQTACFKLVSMANERGGEDNATCIVVRIASLPNPLSRIARLVALLRKGKGV